VWSTIVMALALLTGAHVVAAQFGAHAVLCRIARRRGCLWCSELGVELLQELLQYRLFTFKVLSELTGVGVRDLHPEIGHIAAEHFSESGRFLLG
jgi:hypothetical protein